MYRGGSEIIPPIRYLNMICTQITYYYHYYYYYFYYYCGGGGGGTRIPATAATTYIERLKYFIRYITLYNLLKGIKLAAGKSKRATAAVCDTTDKIDIVLYALVN